MSSRTEHHHHGSVPAIAAAPVMAMAAPATRTTPPTPLASVPLPAAGARGSGPATVLSFTAGYVDTAGFLMLQGLFTAHVTGNFVMIGDALAHGSTGVIAKLMALPVFCVTIVVLQAVALRIAAPPPRALRVLLVCEALFLAAGAVAAIGQGDLAQADGRAQIVTGMLLVIAMAIQNGVQKLHLGAVPPTTMMTGTTTQVMLDLGSLLSGRGTEAAQVVKPRLRRAIGAVATFALGCAGAALAVTQVGPWALALPPVLALAALAVQDRH